MVTNLYDLAQSASFVLDFGALGDLYLTEINGLEEEVEVVDHKIVAKSGTGNLNHKVPGRYSTGTLTVKRAVDGDTTLADWYQKVVEGKVNDARIDGTISVVDQTGGKPLAEWTLTGAWPSKINVSGFGADSDGIVTEEVTINYEVLTRNA